MKRSYFITAIDTDAGKSIVTGVMARYLREKGVNVITRKMAQTGCTGLSEDIVTHRRVMGVPLFAEDRSGMTCPYIFPFPAAPRLSAALVGQEIRLEEIHSAGELLEKDFDCVLTEGVGGLMVPLVDRTTVLDYMKRYPQPTLLVTSGKLGSINHTLLSLEVMSRHGIRLEGMVYNNFIETDPIITADSLQTLREYLQEYYPGAILIEMPRWEERAATPDFSALFGI